MPGLGYIALREFITAISKPRIVIAISLSAIPLNALGNYILMFGKLGLPALGIFGVGLATALVDLLMFLALALYITFHPHFREYKIFRFERPHWDILSKIIRIGLPVGINFGIEEGLFMVVGLLMGYLGVVALAAHQIAIQCMTVAIMIPIGIAQATAIRVSQSMGAHHNTENILGRAYIGIFCGIILSFIAATIFWLFPYSLATSFLDPNISANKPVIALAIKLLAIAALFHIVDAVQLITNGALRGLQDTFAPMLFGLISFWIIGIGSGYIMAFKLKMGAAGLWWGLALGVTVSAILLQVRLFWHKDRLIT